jgi:hypothetical protein
LARGIGSAKALGLDADNLYAEQIWVGKDGQNVRRLDSKGRGRTGMITHIKAILREWSCTSDSAPSEAMGVWGYVKHIDSNEKSCRCIYCFVLPGKSSPRPPFSRFARRAVTHAPSLPCKSHQLDALRFIGRQTMDRPRSPKRMYFNL